MQRKALSSIARIVSSLLACDELLLVYTDVLEGDARLGPSRVQLGCGVVRLAGSNSSSSKGSPEATAE